MYSLERSFDDEIQLAMKQLAGQIDHCRGLISEPDRYQVTVRHSIVTSNGLTRRISGRACESAS